MSRRRRLLALVVAVAVASPAVAAAAAVEAGSDPVLAALVREALEKSPDYARARADAAAERERIPQAGALADPTVTLGIQNDGFNAIQIGKMETSFWQVMITQPLGWPGKRGLRAAAARAQASAVAARLERVQLSTTAEVERAYLDLLLVRGQLELLGRLEALWREAEAVTRTRYAVGAVPQSDLLRAQLELTRLQQQRIGLEAIERTRVQTLNRLRVQPLDEPIPTTRQLADADPPGLEPADEAVADAERRSPDLTIARRSTEAAQRRVASALRERWPDVTVSAGIMPRGGLDPMWTASVGLTVPIFLASKQSRAVAESERRRDAEQEGEASTLQVVRLRARERHAALAALLRTLRLYKDTLLVQSDAAVHSTLGQYRVGKVPFASVLEMLRGYIGDEDGYLETMADAQRVAIAARQVSLDAPPGIGGGAIASGGIPGASGGMGGGGGRASGSAGGAEAPAPAGGGSSGM